MCGPASMHSLMKTWVPLYGSVFGSQSSHFCCHTLFRMCTCIIHEYMSTLHSMSGPPLWIVTWKIGCPCESLHVCPSHLIFVPTPSLECVHASVHEFMSIWLLMSGPAPMHSLMETWEALYGSVFVSQSSYFFCHTLFWMCTCISTWIYVYLTTHVMSTPYGYLIGKLGAPVFNCMCVPVTLIFYPHLV